MRKERKKSFMGGTVVSDFRKVVVSGKQTYGNREFDRLPRVPIAYPNPSSTCSLHPTERRGFGTYFFFTHQPLANIAIRQLITENNRKFDNSAIDANIETPTVAATRGGSRHKQAPITVSPITTIRL